jgi:hypothetical protein
MKSGDIITYVRITKDVKDVKDVKEVKDVKDVKDVEDKGPILGNKIKLPILTNLTDFSNLK